ncbi:MAG TPA: acetylxylan esterase [Tepidisphaeraceae bacterium]|nr:acetylxylan esterase [Tepidisphaeraceae bacterium]
MNLNRLAKTFAFLLLFPAILAAQELVATPLHNDGVYHVGEKIEWNIEVGGQNASSLKSANYVLLRGGLTEVGKGSLDLASGKATLSTKLDEPGTVLVEISATPEGGKATKLLVGAVADPEKIAPSAPKPEDFDAFWKAKIEQLKAIPENAQVEPGDSGDPNVEYFKVRLDNINGTHVYGQLARPKKEGRYPALLLVQYAGVYGLPKTNVVNRAKQGWLALNIIAHDIPFDQPEEYYKQQSAGPLKDYVQIGNTDREKSYFLRMYLGCYRAADYLAERPEWDGKTLVVTGTSQGGQQTLITAGLHPKITAMLANVPGGCDVTGPQVGRAGGFPYWANQAKWQHNPKIVETGRYFDCVNFTGRIHCPAMVSCGLIDQTCPPSGVLAAFNQIQGPKKAIIMVNSDHHGTHNAQAEYFKQSEEWLRDIVQGKALPVK